MEVLMSGLPYTSLSNHDLFSQIVDLPKIASLLDTAQIVDGRKIYITGCGDPILYQKVLAHVYSQIDQLVHETAARQRLMGPSARLIQDRIHKISKNIDFSKWERIVRHFSCCCCSFGLAVCLEEKIDYLVENHFS